MSGKELSEKSPTNCLELLDQISLELLDQITFCGHPQQKGKVENRILFGFKTKVFLIRKKGGMDIIASIYIYLSIYLSGGFQGGASGKEPTSQWRKLKRCGFSPWVGKIPWRNKQQPIPVFLPGKSHEQRNLVGYSPWGCKELGLTD